MAIRHFATVLLTLLAVAGPTRALAQSKKSPPAPQGSAELRKLGQAFAAVAERVSPSVVQIDVSVAPDGDSPLRWFRGEGTQRGLGSGVVFSSDGAILTNNHVIEEARAIHVRLRDGRVLPGKLVGRDPSTDLAVLRVDAKDLPAANFADSDGAKVGEWVVAIGSPFGLGHTVTVGVLSAKGRGGVGVNAVEDYLQTDASINPGNSGGPLVDLDGRVLGINTMIVSKGQGIGLAVPAAIAKRVATQILKTGRVDRAWIGVGIQDLTPQLAAEMTGAPATGGALVNSIAPTGPAAKAHLEAGDIITTLGGKPVMDAQDVIREVFVHAVGDSIPLEVVRSGKRYQTKVTLESRGDAAPPPLPVERPAKENGIGLKLRDVPDAERRGQNTIAQVTGVAADSAADRAGLHVGDFVLEVDATKLPASKDVLDAFRDGHALLRVRRQGATFYVAVKR